MPKFKCNTLIGYNGREYQPESVIELPREHAEPLLNVGAIEPPRKKKEKTDDDEAADAEPAPVDNDALPLEGNG